MSTAEEFMKVGSGAKSFTFAEKNNMGQWQPKPVNTSISGVIDSEPELQQQTDYNTKEKKFFKDGDPMMQFAFTFSEVHINTQPLQLEDDKDDGKRTVYMKKGRGEHRATKDAIEAAGAPGPQPGGRLTLWISEITPNSDSNWPNVQYAAHYQPPAANAVMNSQPVATPAVAAPPAQPAAAATPAAPAPVAPAPVQQAPAAPAPIQAPAPAAAPTGPPAAPQPSQPAPPVAQPAPPAAAGPDVDTIIGQLSQLKLPPEQIAATVGLTVEEVKAKLPPF